MSSGIERLSEASTFASPEDISDIIADATLEKIERIQEIKNAADSNGKVVDLWDTMSRLEKEHSGARGKVAFHLVVGGGLSLSDLEKTVKEFDYPDGEIMSLLEEWYSENIKKQ